MSLARKVVLAAVSLVVVLIVAVPLAWFALATLPALFTPTANDGGTVFVAVAGAFGFAFVLSVPRER